VKDGRVDWTSSGSALADVTNSVTSSPTGDVITSSAMIENADDEVLDLSQRQQTLTSLSRPTSSIARDVTAVSGPVRWCDNVINDDDDDDDNSEQHVTTMSLTTTTPFIKRSCTGMASTLLLPSFAASLLK